MIINLSHYKGGVGKSTLATNIAVALNAAVLDLDGLESSSLFNKLRKSSGHNTLTCYTTENMDELRGIIRKYFNNDEILVVDSGGYDSEINRFVMMAANLIITPVSPSQVEIFGLQKYELILRKMSAKYNKSLKTNVVINNADSRSKTSIRQLKKFINEHNTYLSMFETIIYNRADYKKAYKDGVNVIELNKESKAAFEMNQLVKEINKVILGGN